MLHVLVYCLHALNYLPHTVNNFIVWKLRIMMILDENKVDSYVKDKKAEPEDEL